MINFDHNLENREAMIIYTTKYRHLFHNKITYIVFLYNYITLLLHCIV